jgi:hypothetical protein
MCPYCPAVPIGQFCDECGQLSSQPPARRYRADIYDDVDYVEILADEVFYVHNDGRRVKSVLDPASFFDLIRNSVLRPI